MLRWQGIQGWPWHNRSRFTERDQAIWGVTDISFLVTLTTNASGITPTSFAVALLDSSLFNLPTTGVGDSLLLFNLDGANTTYQTATTTGRTAGVTVSVNAVPETIPTLATLLGVATIAAVWRRQQTCQT